MNAFVGVLGIDWTDCAAVEVVPGKVSGVPILKHTRMQADSVIENYEDGMSVQELADEFSLSEEVVREVAQLRGQRYVLALFEVMITADQNLAYQQNLTGRKLSLIVLSTGRLRIIKEDMAAVTAALALVHREASILSISLSHRVVLPVPGSKE